VILRKTNNAAKVDVGGAGTAGTHRKAHPKQSDPKSNSIKWGPIMIGVNELKKTKPRRVSGLEAPLERSIRVQV